MPRHFFRFPSEVTEAVRSNVDEAIEAIQPSRFRREANYTASLLGNSSQFWLNLQAIYDLRVAEQKAGAAIKTQRTLSIGVRKTTTANRSQRDSQVSRGEALNDC